MTAQQPSHAEPKKRTILMMIKEKLRFNHHLKENKEKKSKDVTKTTKEEIPPANQQAALLDALNTRLNETQIKLEHQSKTIQQQDANRIVKNHVLTGSAIGLLPLPVVDVVALSSNQLNMLLNLSQHYQVAFDKKKAKVALLALLSGSLPTLSIVGLSSGVKLIPGMGTLGGNASLSVLGGAITYATGQSFVKHFDNGGTLHDFKAKHFTHFFKQELKKGRQFIQRKRENKATEITHQQNQKT